MTHLGLADATWWDWASDHGPWAVIAVALTVFIFWTLRFLAKKFFDDEKGLVPTLVRRHTEHLDRSDETSRVTAEAMTTQSALMKDLCRKMEGAHEAGHHVIAAVGKIGGEQVADDILRAHRALNK